ncbi:hypothetical protein H5T52_02165 [Candidatus Bipolaricaulota bacterium]|nr:hypothetical protein [Candidatus Bipolaricaulota bacterium]
MELRLSGRIAEDVALGRYRELLEKSLRQARLGKAEDQETVAPKRRHWVWRFITRQAAHETAG